ncbi:MAG: DUF1566 domain-containing protein [Bacteroidetes bacterium]|nr:DUF1566 domain-containing protein [Bacteroidota bacterium]
MRLLLLLCLSAASILQAQSVKPSHQSPSGPIGQNPERVEVKVCWSGRPVDYVRIDDRRAPIPAGTCVTMKLKVNVPLRISVQLGTAAYTCDSVLFLRPEGGELRLRFRDSSDASSGITYAYETPSEKKARLAKVALDSAARVAAAAEAAAKAEQARQEAKNRDLRNLIVTVNGRKLKVYEKDLSPTDWQGAVETCRFMGNGWRLPNEAELRAVQKQLHQEGAGGFAETWYWTDKEESTGIAWAMHMKSGNTLRNPKDYRLNVRPVRDL